MLVMRCLWGVSMGRLPHCSCFLRPMWADAPSFSSFFSLVFSVLSPGPVSRVFPCSGGCSPRLFWWQQSGNFLLPSLTARPWVFAVPRPPALRAGRANANPPGTSTENPLRTSKTRSTTRRLKGDPTKDRPEQPRKRRGDRVEGVELGSPCGVPGSLSRLDPQRYRD